MKRNALFYTSCIATDSNNIFSSLILPHTIACSHIFLQKKKRLLKWNPDFTNLQGKRKLVRKIGEFEKSGVKLPRCSTKEGKRLLVRAGWSYREVRKTEGSRSRDSTIFPK